jgi:hypothetical protein
MVYANFDKILSFGTPVIKADKFFESLLDIQEGRAKRVSIKIPTNHQSCQFNKISKSTCYPTGWLISD